MNAQAAYEATDYSETRSYLRALANAGRLGRIAAALFAAMRASTDAKTERRLAKGDPLAEITVSRAGYARKRLAMQKVCELLAHNAAGLAWGWGNDRRQADCPFVLFVDLPQGQVSFHTPEKLMGPEYAGRWDRACQNRERVLAFCDALLPSNGQQVLGEAG